MTHLGEVGWAVTRITFGVSLAVFHGYGKVFEGKVAGLTQTVANLGFPFPSFFAWAASLSEFAGGLLVALGLFTRPAAALCAFTMVVALFNHLSRNDPAARLELALLYLVVMLLAVFTGGGRYSLDRYVRIRSPFGRSA